MKRKQPRGRIPTDSPRPESPERRVEALLERAECVLSTFPPTELEAGGTPILIALSLAVDEARTKLLRVQSCAAAFDQAEDQLRAAGIEVRRLTEALVRDDRGSGTSQSGRPSGARAAAS